MRYLVRKDIKTRQRLATVEIKFRILHGLSRCALGDLQRYMYLQLVDQFKKNSVTLVRNRCRYTGHARSVWRIYHIARGAFRSSAHFGWFFGIKRVTW